MKPSSDLNHRFLYHPPTSEDTRRLHEGIRDSCRVLAEALESACPESRELSLALTRVEEAMFWANAAVARHQ